MNPTSRFRVPFLPIALVLSLGCAQHAPTEQNQNPPVAQAPATDPGHAAAPSGENGMHADLADDDAIASEKFGEGAKSFAKVRETLLANYYSEGMTEDDLYRAATAGMLEKLEPKMRKWNRLLTARELSEMKNDLHGEVVGIGVHIAFDSKSGYADVLATLPGSPSEKAGLEAGDKIVTVNGKLYKGMRMKDVVADIRGKTGETVTLVVLRGDHLQTFSVVRDRVAYDQPTSLALPENVGYLRIPSFTDKTPGAVRASLEDLKKKNVRSLVVDLRNCPGGSFDRALETASLLLPEGKPIVVLKRKGKPEEKHLAKGGGILTDVPLVVVVNDNTASGAEFVTAALREERGARVVGQKTLGKWSVQSVDDLPNGWAFKYTVSLFRTPAGKTYEGVGVAPDVDVAMDEKQLARANAAPKVEDRLALDVQLRTARQLVR
jgi:carboxyl-terminal processing protease